MENETVGTVQLRDTEIAEVKKMDEQLGNDKILLADITLQIAVLEAQKSGAVTKIQQQGAAIMDRLHGIARSNGIDPDAKDPTAPRWSFSFQTMSFTPVK